VQASAAYDETIAQTMVKLSGTAYCSGTIGQGVENWSCKTCQELPYVTATVVYDKQRKVTGCVGYCADTNSIIIAFSGTDPLSIKNWIADLSLLMCDYTPPTGSSNSCEGCKVHQGFYEGYLSVQEQVHAALDKYLALYPTAQLQFTGHSLGAALTAHAALDVFLTYGIVPTDLYNYGSPRMGNDAFAVFFNQTLTGSATQQRVVHHKDPVPHLLLESLGYRHSPWEVFYNEKNTEFQICDGSGEDPSCSDQYLLDVNILDHLNYLKFSFTDNYLHCKL
jgi:hypothetical protein